MYSSFTSKHCNLSKHNVMTSLGGINLLRWFCIYFKEDIEDMKFLSIGCTPEFMWMGVLKPPRRKLWALRWKLSKKWLCELNCHRCSFLLASKNVTSPGSDQIMSRLFCDWWSTICDRKTMTLCRWHSLQNY